MCSPLVSPVRAEDLFRIENNSYLLKWSPGFKLSAPLGFAGGLNIAFIGLFGSYHQTKWDGSLPFGTGFGNSNIDLGGSVSISIPRMCVDVGFL